MTKLIEAIQRQDIGIAKSLIQAGFDVNKNEGHALQVAIYGGEPKKKKELILSLKRQKQELEKAKKTGRGIDVSMQKLLDGLFEEIDFAPPNSFQKEIIELLIRAGARVDIRSSAKSFKGRTSFMNFLKGEAINLTDEDEQALFFQFSSKLSNVNVQDDDGKTLLFYSVDTIVGGFDFELTPLEKVLFTKGVKVNLTNNHGETALCRFLLSLEKGEREILRRKAWQKYRCDAPSDNEESHKIEVLLRYRCNFLLDDETKNKIEMLLMAGSDIELKNENGDSPKTIAQRIGNKRILFLIENHKKLLNTEDQTGRTPLLIACQQGETEKVKWLLARGANVNAKNSWHKRSRGIELYDHSYHHTHYEEVRPKLYTALMGAQNIATIEALLEVGADVNAQSSNGDTALMVYARDNWMEGVAKLISAGANPNLVNKYYETALIISRKNNSFMQRRYHRESTESEKKLIRLLEDHTTNKLIPSILSPLFCLFRPHSS